MRRFECQLLFLFSIIACNAQGLPNLILKGDYSETDSINMVRAVVTAYEGVEQMYEAMNEIWEANGEKNKKELRIERWNERTEFTKWLGKPKKIGKAKRIISKIHSKFNKKFILEVTKGNTVRCRGWISAWTIPFGKVKIRLCEDFFIYRTHLQDKIIVHELGHEAGILFHRRIHGCRAAHRAALLNTQTSKRSVENYAWLAMSYVGLTCAQ